MDCRRTFAGVVLSLVIAMPAAGQTVVPAPAPGTQVAAPAAQTSPPVIRTGAAADRGADARNCLGFNTNREVILCAEKYLPARRNS